MDASLRQTIIKALESEKSLWLVKKVYNDLKISYQNSLDTDTPNVCGLDLYVQCAELALKYDELEMAENCVSMYFNANYVPNQFLCRAYMCQAQIQFPSTSTSINDLLTGIVYLMKTLDFCQGKPRYSFIVYNTSVLYWNMIRPFFKSPHQAKLCESFARVVKCLDAINDDDYDWRATLKIGMLESFAFAGNTVEASKAAKEAYWFCVRKCQDRVAEVIKLQIKYELVELDKLSTEIADEYNAFILLQKLKTGETGEHEETITRLKEIVISLKNETSIRKTLSMNTATKLTPHQSSNSSSSSKSRKSSLMSTTLTVRPNEDNEEQLFAEARNDREARLSYSEASNTKALVPVKDMRRLKMFLRVSLLYEIARFCVDTRHVQLARLCLRTLAQQLGGELRDPTVALLSEFCECDLMLLEGGGCEERPFAKSSVEQRLGAIRRMTFALQNARRSGRANVVQAGCAGLWNMCLPLLQKDLRKLVCRTLHLIAEALEDISSINFQLCCQVHTEIAITEESLDQNETAMKHLRKAIKHDHSGLYAERLNNMMHRLTLSSQLYQTPKSPEDLAAVIIEQAKKSSESGTMSMKRSLLVKVGLALAPDAFQNVLDGEDESKVSKTSKDTMERLANKAHHWEKSMKKVKGHLKRFGNDNDRQRARLWVDLVKTARHERIWDVCRAGSAFCLLYDDQRWAVNEQPASGASSGEYSTSSGELSRKSADSPGGGGGSDSALSSRASGGSVSGKESSLAVKERNSIEHQQNCDFMRMLAEVHFICGEAFVHLVQSEGVELNDSPRKPAKQQQRAKDNADNSMSDSSDQQADKHWKVYCDWIGELHRKATDSFLRGVEIGVELNRSWLVCSGAIYLWNYNCHLLKQQRADQLVTTFQTLLKALRRVGHLNETVLVVRICNAIGRGLITPWMPKPPQPDAAAAAGATSGKAPSPGKKSAVKDKKGGGGGGKGDGSFKVSPNAADDLKQAQKVVEYALKLTNGSNKADVVSMFARRQLIATWVQIMQMSQIPISEPDYGSENERLPHQREMTKCLVVMEMISLNNDNQLTKFVVPTLEETYEMLEGSESGWRDDAVLEMSVWDQLCSHARHHKQHQLAARCAEKALRLQQDAVKSATACAKNQTNNYRLVWLHEILSNVYRARGEITMLEIKLNPGERPQALRDFVESTKHGEKAGNYEMVIGSSRRWWQTAVAFLHASPATSHCDKLRQPLNQLLACIRQVVKMKEAKEKKMKKKRRPIEGVTDACGGTEEEKDKDADLTLRVSLYRLLFKTYAVKNEWEEGLKMVEQAVVLLPRTKHRIPLFKDRVIAKAKLGHDVYMDLNKFKDEDEESVARIWRQVALSSVKRNEQLFGYQRAVEALTSPHTSFLKHELLLELSQWMYDHDCKIQDCKSVVEWSCDVLINITRRLAGGKKASASRRGSAASRRSNSRGGSAAAGGRKSPSLSGKRKSPRRSDSGKKKEQEAAGSGKDSRKQSLGKEEQEEVKHLIGVDPFYPDLTFADLNQVRQLEGLMRCNVQLAILTPASDPQHIDHLHLAAFYVSRMWKVSHEPAMLMKKKMRDSEGGGGGKTGDKKDNKKAAEPVGKAKKTSDDHLPATSSGWACYEVSDEMIQAHASPHNQHGLNLTNLPQPHITLDTLLTLSDLLSNVGSHHLVMQVLAMASLISQTSLDKTSRLLVQLNQIKSSYELNHLQAAHYWESQLDELPVSAQDLAACRQDEQASGDGGVGGGGNSSKPSRLIRLFCKCARVFFKLGRVQQGRLMVSEASDLMERRRNVTASKCNDDGAEAELRAAQADLAVRDGDAGKALTVLEQAQRCPNNLYLWEDIMELMVETVTLARRPHGKDLMKASDMLKHAEGVLDQILQANPTKQHQIRRLRLLMSARRLLLDLHIRSNDLGAAVSELEKVEQELADHVSTRRICSLRTEHATHALVALQHQQRKHHVEHYLLRHIGVLEQAVRHITRDIGLITRGCESDVSLPVQRERCQLEILLSSYLLHAEEIHMFEYRQAENIKATKSATEKIVERYVSHPTVLEGMGSEEWRRERSTFLHRALTLLNSLYCRSTVLKQLSPTWSCLMGKGLRLLSQRFNYEHVDYQWRIDDILTPEDLDTAGTLSNNEDSGSNHQRKGELSGSYDKSSYEYDYDQYDATATPDYDCSNRKTLGYSRDMADSQSAISGGSALLNNCQLANRALSHASEVLGQAIRCGLRSEEVDMVGEACENLIECSGQCDPSLTSAALALMQTCTSVKEMRSVLDRSLFDPTSCLLSSFTWQLSFLQRNSLSSGLHRSTIANEINRVLLQRTVPMRKLKVSYEHMDLMREMPASYACVVLQEKRKLFADNHIPTRFYCSLARSLASGGGGNGAKGASIRDRNHPASAPLSFAAVATCRIDEVGWRACRLRGEDWEQRRAAHLLKIEHHRSQSLMKSRIMANVHDSASASSQVPPRNNDANDDDNLEQLTRFCQEEEDSLKLEFDNILSQLGDCMKPISDFVEANLVAPRTIAYHNSPISLPCGTDVEGGGDIQASVNLIFIVNRAFFTTSPGIESLQSFRFNKHILSMSRDLSLQLLHRRMAGDGDTDVFVARTGARSGRHTGGASGKGSKKGKAPRASAAPTPKTPGGGGTSGENVKIDARSTRYMVDAHNETVEASVHRPAEVFASLVKQHHSANSWSGCYGSEQAPSAHAWEQLLTSATLFIYYGMEPFTSQLQPYKLVSLRMNDLGVALLVDKAQTNRSFIRQSRENGEKQENIVTLEKPYETCVLLSLNGVRSVCMNQYHTTSQANAHNLAKLVKSLVGENCSLGKAVRKIRVLTHIEKPPKKRPETPRGQAASSSPTTKKASTKDSGKKSRPKSGKSASKKSGKKSKEATPAPPPEEEEERDVVVIHPPTAESSNLTLVGLPNLTLV